MAALDHRRRRDQGKHWLQSFWRKFRSDRPFAIYIIVTGAIVSFSTYKVYERKFIHEDRMMEKNRRLAELKHNLVQRQLDFQLGIRYIRETLPEEREKWVLAVRPPSSPHGDLQLSSRDGAQSAGTANGTLTTSCHDMIDEWIHSVFESKIKEQVEDVAASTVIHAVKAEAAGQELQRGNEENQPR